MYREQIKISRFHVVLMVVWFGANVLVTWQETSMQYLNVDEIHLIGDVLFTKKLEKLDHMTT